LWRRWIVCLYNWGADPADLKRLTVGSIQYGDGSPRQPLRKRLYVTFVRKKTKKKKKRAIILPLHRVVARHVAPLLNGLALGGPSSRPLFPFPKNNRDMKAQYERILAEAGIPLTLKDADGQEIDNKLYFHDFRKTCNSAIDEVAPGIGEEILGHAPQGVNNKHYLLIIARRIRKAIDRLKQPREFGRLERQRRLF
jgi:integrase